jgi:Domain of unknown function (DUF4249)
MRKLIFVILLFVVCACELVVDVDVPFEGAQLTVNSFFNTNNYQWEATVSLNRSIFEKDEEPYQLVTDATVSVYDENGNANTLSHRGQGRYISNTEKPLAGKRYRLAVSAPGYETVESESVAPVPVPITDFTIEQQSLNESLITIKFKDNGAEQNYYFAFADVESETYNSITDEVATFKTKVFMNKSEEEGGQLNSQFIQIEEGILMSDALFNGKEFELSFKTSSRNFNGGAYSHISATLYTVSKDYYEYKATKYLQNENSGNPFAQPVNVYNNIKNGFGVFAGLSQSISRKELTTPISITSITPTQGKPGDEIVITGNFENTSYVNISFQSSRNGFRAFAPILGKNNTQIRVKIPTDAITGKVVAFAGGRVAVSDAVFEVIE